MLRIIQANISEVSLIESIVKEAYEKYIPIIGRPPFPLIDDYEKLISDNKVHVIFFKDIIVGICVISIEDDCVFLENFAIKNEYQNKGFGRLLFALAEVLAKWLQKPSIQLCINKEMELNHAFYKRLGYAEIDICEENGLTIVYLGKNINIHK